MSLELIETCPHDISERDVAHQVDGLCPLCLAADVHRLSKALEKIDAVAVQKKVGAAKTMQQIARRALFPNGERP